MTISRSLSDFNSTVIAEDFPPAIISQRRQLYPLFKAAKSLLAFHKKVTMRADKTGSQRKTVHVPGYQRCSCCHPPTQTG